MILLKVGDDGELHWNHEEIVLNASLYDKGWRTPETEKAKIFQLIWEHGYNTAIDCVNTQTHRTMLLLGEAAGHA